MFAGVSNSSDLTHGVEQSSLVIMNTFSATSWSAMIQSAPEAVSLPRMSLLWSCVVPGSRVTLALMVPMLMIHHSGTLGRIQTAFFTPRLEMALAAF